MWQEDYLESLAPLPGALDEVGLSTQVVGVSLAPNDAEKWDHSFAGSILGGIPTMLEILEDTGFLFLLGKFSSLLKGLETAGLLFAPEVWKTPSERGVLQILTPISRVLVQLAPWKIYHSFWGLRDFLEEVDEDDWEGPNCVGYLAVLQQGLEDLQPHRTLNCFEALHDFLTFQQPCLAWLASHPEVHEPLGRLNFFPTLVLAKQVMEFGMEYYNDCLTDLQEVLEDLDDVDAIVPSPDDLDMY